MSSGVPATVCRLLVTLGIIGTPISASQAQVGIASRVAHVSLVVRAASHGSMPAVGVPRRIGRRGTLTETAVRIQLAASSGYRLVARGSAGAVSRVWIQVGDGGYRELVPGAALTLSREPRGSSEREVRYLTDASTAEDSTELPVRFELVVDPAI